MTWTRQIKGSIIYLLNLCFHRRQQPSSFFCSRNVTQAVFLINWVLVISFYVFFLSFFHNHFCRSAKLNSILCFLGASCQFGHWFFHSAPCVFLISVASFCTFVHRLDSFSLMLAGSSVTTNLKFGAIYINWEFPLCCWPVSSWTNIFTRQFNQQSFLKTELIWHMWYVVDPGFAHESKD